MVEEKGRSWHENTQFQVIPQWPSLSGPYPPTAHGVMNSLMNKSMIYSSCKALPLNTRDFVGKIIWDLNHNIPLQKAHVYLFMWNTFNPSLDVAKVWTLPAVLKSPSPHLPWDSRQLLAVSPCEKSKRKLNISNIQKHGANVPMLKGGMGDKKEVDHSKTETQQGKH